VGRSYPAGVAFSSGLLATLATVAAAISGAAASRADGVPGCPASFEELNGVATYYAATGGGNCGFAPGDLMVTAVAAPDWAGSSECGRCLEVWGPEARIVVRVVDQCPECPPGHLDLSAKAFDLIAEPIQGIVPVSFRSVPCPVAGNVVLHQKDGVNIWWFAVQVRNHRFAIASVELRENGSATWQAMTRQDYNYFLLTSGPGLQFPVDLRLTDIHQHAIVERIQTVAPQGDTVGAHQFPRCAGVFVDGFDSGTAAPWWSASSP
jgi:expansin (peptidoglycan-binding protein)